MPVQDEVRDASWHEGERVVTVMRDVARDTPFRDAVTVQQRATQSRAARLQGTYVISDKIQPRDQLPSTAAYLPV